MTGTYQTLVDSQTPRRNFTRPAIYTNRSRFIV